jgi:hypothetical protein
MNEMRDRLVEYIENAKKLYEGDVTDLSESEYVAECLLSDGVIVPQWISVKDRLPDKNGKYLCANYSKTFNRYFIEVLKFAKDLHKVDEFDFKEEKGKSGFYMYDSEWGYSHFRNVTHWMPLPEPPKAEQKLKEMRGE